MIARFLGRGSLLAAAVLGLAFALGTASPAFAQGPGAPRPQARPHSAKAGHGHKHRHKHRHGHKATTVEQARRNVERQSQQVRRAMMKLSEARRELASLSGHPGSRTTAGNPFRGGGSGGFGRGIAGPGSGTTAGNPFRGGFGGGITGPANFGGGMSAGRSGGGVAGFGGSFGGMGGWTSSSTQPSRATSSTQDIVQLKKDVAELRDTVNKLAEIVKNRR